MFSIVRVSKLLSNHQQRQITNNVNEDTKAFIRGALYNENKKKSQYQG